MPQKRKYQHQPHIISHFANWLADNWDTALWFFIKMRIFLELVLWIWISWMLWIFYAAGSKNCTTRSSNAWQKQVLKQSKLSNKKVLSAKKAGMAVSCTGPSKSNDGSEKLFVSTWDKLLELGTHSQTFSTFSWLLNSKLLFKSKIWPAGWDLNYRWISIHLGL